MNYGLCFKEGKKSVKESALWFKEAMHDGVLEGLYHYATMLENDFGLAGKL